MALLRLAYECVACGQRAFARRILCDALDDARRTEVDITVPYVLYLLARLDLDEGHWDDALAAAQSLVLHADSCSTLARTSGLVVIGLVRARRGDAGASAPLDTAWNLVAPTGDVDHIELVASARAEVAWLEGRPGATQRAVSRAVRAGVAPSAGTMRYWWWRGGGSAAVEPSPADPRALAMAGDWRAAAEAWDAIGVPYEAAMARLDADDPDALLHALDVLQRLGARPLQAMVAARLRRRDATTRRPLRNDSTCAPAGNVSSASSELSGREHEVHELVAEGCSNREIARRLFISPHTAANHVRAILRKTATSNRTEAAAVFYADLVRSGCPAMGAAPHPTAGLSRRFAADARAPGPPRRERRDRLTIVE